MVYRICCKKVEVFYSGPEEQILTKFIQADEKIIFEHDPPSHEDIHNKLDERLRNKYQTIYPGCMFTYKDIFKKERVK